LPPCLVGIEACSSSHYWARELIARGHEVRLIPAQYVKPYVKRGKNDAADAEAICEAVTRPTMRFVPVKTPEQQSVMMLHRVRLMLNRQRTQLSNSIRAHLSEFGIVAPIGRRGIDQLLAIVADENDARVPADARLCLQMLAAQLIVVKQQILENDRRVRASARATDLGRRLMDIPGRRPAARQRAYCNDLRSVRIQDRTRPLRLDRYLRQMLVVGAMAVIRYAERHGTRRPWLLQLMQRRSTKVAAVALANKMARMIWALMTSGERYREPMAAKVVAA
jgi:transposase